jgi:hypothetical protein
VRRLFSIVFIAILLFSVMGYYGVLIGLQYRNHVAVNRSLDLDRYDASQTITIKIPVSIPYTPDQENFERVSGEFEYDGQLYRLVKQRYARDTLTVVCVRDNEHVRIHRALSDYVKTFTDNATTDSSPSKITFTFLKDYIAQKFTIHTHASGWKSEIHYTTHSNTLTSTFPSAINHPPELV